MQNTMISLDSFQTKFWRIQFSHFKLQLPFFLPFWLKCFIFSSLLDIQGIALAQDLSVSSQSQLLLQTIRCFVANWFKSESLTLRGILNNAILIGNFIWSSVQVCVWSWSLMLARWCTNLWLCGFKGSNHNSSLSPPFPNYSQEIDKIIINYSNPDWKECKQVLVP